jgi:hypothetical protein
MSLGEVEAAEVLHELELCETARSQTDRVSQAATADTHRAQAVLDAVHDGARALVNRNRELRTSASAVRDSLERARLATLNAGLEGARIGEPLGKAVLTMADETRALLARALESLEDHLSLLSELERERDRWFAELLQSRELCGSAAQRLRELGGLEAASSQALGRLGASLRRHLGSEPERAKLLSQASEQARALRESLARLRELGASDPESLQALLEPIASLMSRGSGSP